ncbi:MAG TPA: acetate--CoA ligase family protein [Ktedonobacteraceae bacterium]|jgi:acyl-CoA synthetase (NDP forming)|nr:acetate--CoA ligase family protein [Ktedonobacteraceae bacterium]
MNQPVPITTERLRAFFHPHSIALVGATDRSRWSINTYQNLKAFGYTAPIYCVNPNYEVVHGEPAVKRLGDIPEAVDLAFIMVPTRQVYPVLEEAAAAGISNIVILTSGFSEMGSQGQVLEQHILDFARQQHMIVLGPNGNGFVNVTAQILPYGLPVQPPLVKGPVGVVLQSGALASSVITLAQARHIGLSLLVSMGNETMLSAMDIMNYLVEDDETRVIAVFLETIRRAAIFKQIAQKALERGKPIVALKVGRGEVSARAAKAHTGALVGNDVIHDAIFRQSGVIRVTSLEDLLITAGLLGYGRPISGRRMGLVTPSGGACDILADRAEEEGIQLPDFAPTTVQRLGQVLPEFSTIHNPLDVTGYIVVDRTLQQQALKVVIEDPNLDFIVYLSEPPRVEPPASQLEAYLEQYKALGELTRRSRIPIIVMSNTCIDLPPFSRFIADTAGIHFAGGMEHGMTALGKALWWYETRQQASEQPQEPLNVLSPLPLPAAPSGNWSEFTARQFLQAQGIPVVPGALANDAEEAVRAAQSYGFPVALKIQAPDIQHKSDVGGVLLNLANEAQVRDGFAAIMNSTARYSKAIEGIFVSPMRPPGVELLVGILHDPLWGQVLATGLGGIWAEVFKDTSVRVLPISRQEIRRMLFELRGASLLQGTRGQPPVNIEKLVDIIFRITRVAQKLEEQLEALEINPLLLYDENIEALDVLMTWQAKQENE